MASVEEAFENISLFIYPNTQYILLPIFHHIHPVICIHFLHIIYFLSIINSVFCLIYSRIQKLDLILFQYYFSL